MAFSDTYRESIQTKHLANVGFTSTAKGVTNEAFALVNPHQVLASQIPSIDVLGTYGALVVDGINAGLVEKHTVKLTADPTVNNNKAWIATEDNCTEAGHSTRGALRLGQWMRYAGTQYKLRLYEDTGSNTPDYTSEVLPSETSFNWEYDASAGAIYFDADPSGFSKTLPLWGEFYTYIGYSVAESLDATTSGIGDLIEGKSDIGHDHDSSYDVLGAASSTVSGHESTWGHDSFVTYTEVSTVSGVLQDQIDNQNLYFVTDAELVLTSGTLQDAIDQNTSDISNLDSELTTISGYLQGQIETLDDTYTTDAELSAVSGTLQSAINIIALDISTNYYTTTELNDGQLDNRYYTETEIDLLLSSTSGTSPIEVGVLDDKIDTTSGTLQSEIDDLDVKIDTTSGTLQLEINTVTLNLSTNYYTSGQVDTLLTGYSTTAEVTSLLAAQDSFLELNDTIGIYNSDRVLSTTASGVVDNASFTFDYVDGTLNVTGIQLGTGGVVNETVTTVTSGATDNQIPSAKAVWDLVEASPAAGNTYFDVDATYVTDTTWSYGSGFSVVPENLAIYVNGMKNRAGVDNDYTVDVSGGVLTLTFTYRVESDFWVNITYVE